MPTNNNIIFGVDLLPRIPDTYDLGNTTYTWNNIYAKKIVCNGADVITSHALGYGKISINADNGTSAITANTTQLTAASANDTFTFKTGNKWLVVAGSNTSNSDVLTIGHALSGISAKTTFGGTETSANANGGTITVTDIKFDAAGHITGSQDRTITLSQLTYSTFVGSGNSHASGLVPDPGATAGTTKFLCENGNWTNIPIANSDVIGGIKIGYTTLYPKYAVQLDQNNHQAYVEIPWIYHTTGVWNDLTYTATTIGSNENTDKLSFTIPTGTSSTEVAIGNHVHGNITNDGKMINSTSSTASMAIGTNSSSEIIVKDLSVSDPTVPSSGETTSTSFIATISQDAEGKITATKRELISYLPTAGGILTGNLKLVNNNIQLLTNDTNQNYPFIIFGRENDDNDIGGQISVQAASDGSTIFAIKACNLHPIIEEGQTTYSSIDAGITIKLSRDETCTYTVSNPQAFREAISALGPGANTLNTYGYIARDGAATGSFYQGRKIAIIRMTSVQGYSTVLSAKTTSGSWEVGAYNAETLNFVYVKDSDYNASNNYYCRYGLKPATYTSAYTKYLTDAFYSISRTNKTFTLTSLDGTTTTIDQLNRPIALNGTVKLADTNETVLDFIPGSNISITYGTGGKFTFAATGLAVSGHNHDTTYLKLSGGNVTGAIIRAIDTIKLDTATNGATTSSGFYVADYQSTTFARFIGGTTTSDANGYETYIQMAVRNTNTSASAYSYRGITVYMNKDGTVRYNVYSAAAFRSAIGAGTSSLAIGTSSTTAAAGNHTHSYLPLSGGTMTGVLSLKASQYGGPDGAYGLDCKNSDIIKVNAIFTADAAGDTGEGINFYRSASAWDSMTAYSGTFYFMANHAYAADYSTSATANIRANKVYGAVWNDYAEYRKGQIIEGGYCVTETSSGTLVKTTERLQPGCRVTSDTFGFAIGETKECKTPIAVSGRVLVYPYRAREEYELGAAVCSAPEGTVDIMTRDEIIMYPERIIGTVSEIPNYKYWECGGDEDNIKNRKKILINNRIWIYVK